MKWEESYDLLEKSVKRLREASDKTEKHKLDKEIYRDATIQRFEFTVELFWKTLKRILENEKIDARTPKQVLRDSYQVGLINDEEYWLMMLEDRNRSSHTYSEKAAKEVYGRIKKYVIFLEKELESVGVKYPFSKN